MGKVAVRGGETRALAVQIIANGGTLEEAAERTGFCSDYVRQLAVQAGVRKTVKDKNRELAEELRGLALSGITLGTAAKELGLPYTTVSNTSRKYGIKFAEANRWERRSQKAREKREEMRELRDSGVSIEDISKRYGAHMNYVKKICRGLGDSYDSRLNNALKVMEQNAPGFEYVGGYVGVDHHVTIRCKECGNEFSQSFISIRAGHNIRCDVCRARELEAKRLEDIERKKAERLKEIERKKAEREQRRIEKALLSPTVQLEMSVCECCGSLFMKPRSNSSFCSDCKKKVQNARSKDKRIKRIKAAKCDPITLERLYEKEKGVCYLCGGMCDKDAYSVRDDGTFIALNNYPSIEHVVPLSRGGTHTWDNVRLAHRICNSVKGANVAG